MPDAVPREQIDDVLSDSTRPLEDRIDEALEIGIDYLGLSVGFCTRIEAGVQEIEYATGDHELIRSGRTCPLSDAYCRRTLELKSPLAVENVSGSPEISDSAVETFGLKSYIGARVVVEDETRGTICFADTETREDEFSDSERFFVELAARLLGQLYEQRSYEQELRGQLREINEKDEVTRALVDASFDFAFRIDSDGRLTYVSPAVENLLGHPESAFLGESFLEFCPDPEAAAIAVESFETAMRGETVETPSFPLDHETAGRVLVDVRMTPLYAGDVPPAEQTPSDVMGVQGMVRDASQRHRHQRIIRVLNRVLRHNLRNDIGIITGYADLLQERLDDGETVYAHKIAETSERLMRLSETARKIEKGLDAPPEIETLDVVPVVTRTVAQIEDRYPDASITVTAPDSAAAKCAPRLETAVWELLDNAAHHAGATPSIDVDLRVADDRVAVSITDDGPGLPEQERDVLVSGEETPLVHGSGLGLWLVHWVVETIDGAVTVHDREDGTRVEITLRRPETAALSD